MSDLKAPLTRDPPLAIEEQVRAKLLNLASEFADRAKDATDAAEAQTFAESAAVLFDAAKVKTFGDPPPIGG